MTIDLPLTSMKVYARVVVNDQQIENNVYEGEAKMTQQQQDQFQALVGDGKARVSVGRDLANKDFGNGGGVLVNVTLTCDQSQPAIQQAIHMAYQMADQAAWYYQDQVLQTCRQKGMLR